MRATATTAAATRSTAGGHRDPEWHAPCRLPAGCGHVRKRATAAELACRVTIRPEGFALLSPGAISSVGTWLPAADDRRPALSAQSSVRSLIWRLSRCRPPWQVSGSCRQDGSVRDCCSCVRKPRSWAGVSAAHSTIWDNRFRLLADGDMPKDAIDRKAGRRRCAFQRSFRPAVGRSADASGRSESVKFWKPSRIWDMRPVNMAGA